MKKYLLFPDVEDTASAHIVEMPRNIFIKVKACTDGVAIAIGDKDKGEVFGLTVNVDKQFHPLLKRLIALNKAKELVEEDVFLWLEIAITEFLDDDTKGILQLDDEVARYAEDMYRHLCYIDNCLREEDAKAAEQQHSTVSQKAKKNKPNKKHK